MKKRRLSPANDTGENVMKTILLLGYSGALGFCALGQALPWALRLALGAAASLALLHELSRRAPVGYQGESGFHYSNAGSRSPRGKDSLIAALLSSTRSALKV
jgi:hypothetical protein